MGRRKKEEWESEETDSWDGGFKVKVTECFWCGTNFDLAYSRYCPDCGGRRGEEDFF